MHEPRSLPRFADLALAAGEITEIAPFVPQKEETEPPRHFLFLLENSKESPGTFWQIADRGFRQPAQRPGTRSSG
jgi:hypothetical protein